MRMKPASTTKSGWHELLAHPRPGEAEDLQDEADDAAQVPALGHLDAGGRHRAGEPRDHAIAQVAQDVRHELAHALAHRTEQVAQEPDRGRATHTPRGGR